MKDAGPLPRRGPASRVAKTFTTTSQKWLYKPSLPPRILLVEDEETIRDVLVPLLFSAGYDCREAADGRAAIGLLRSGTRINLVLSNMFLPKVDGWTLFLHVRKYYPRIPFAFVTAIDDSGVGTPR
jgi:CheY-like chemotaxis protein